VSVNLHRIIEQSISNYELEARDNLHNELKQIRDVKLKEIENAIVDFATNLEALDLHEFLEDSAEDPDKTPCLACAIKRVKTENFPRRNSLRVEQYARHLLKSFDHRKLFKSMLSARYKLSKDRWKNLAQLSLLWLYYMFHDNNSPSIAELRLDIARTELLKQVALFSRFIDYYHKRIQRIKQGNIGKKKIKGQKK